MADVFVSWGNADEEPVKEFVRRLDQAGLDFFEYTDGMRAGDEIQGRVLEEIRTARLAILCMSDQTIGTEWLQRELHWSYDALGDEQRPMRALLPVTVGPTDLDRVPRLLRDSGLYIFDLASRDRAEDGFTRLLRDIQGWLGARPPVVIPATVLAMTRERSEQLLEGPADLADLRSLCRTAGMSLEAEFPDCFLRRYGESAREFTPFADGQTVVWLTEEVLRRRNRARRGDQPAVSVQWFTPNLLLGQGDAEKAARRHWRQDRQLMIVDSVSLLDRQVDSEFRDILPLTRNDERRALVWVPPYTRHTRQIQDLTGTVVESQPALEAAFQDWSESLERNLAFDTSTSVGFRRWLDQTFRGFLTPRSARAELLDEMRRHAGASAIDPDRMNLDRRRRA